MKSFGSTFRQWLAGVALLSIGVLGFPSSAAAHHALQGRSPANALEGFVSGLAHPVIGIDHFAFIVAIGLLCATQQRGLLILTAFIGAALAGTGLHLMQLDLPAVEVLIAGSVMMFGALLVAAKTVNSGLLAGLGAIAGVLHGYAYGEAIVGVGMSPLIAYLIGFSVMQYGVALAALLLGRALSRRSAPQFSALTRFAGLAIAAIGVLALTNALFA